MSQLIKNSDHVIHLGSSAWSQLNEQISQGQWSTIFVLTDQATRQFCLPIFEQHINKANFIVLSIPQGEGSKSIEWTQKLWEKLAQSGADRKSLVINLGGGVVTDIGGFVASTFRRGIDFINIPTTLLAMVDAAIGGKTGIDLGVLKNQIGVVAQPKAIFIFPVFLETLPTRELASGWMEMVKHGFISNDEYLHECLITPKREHKNLAALIWKSVQIKNEVVSQDPFEHGRRKTLNFGHTLGHAVESYCLDHYPENYIKHGEAIGIGMILALYLSYITQGFPKDKLMKHCVSLTQMFPNYQFDRKAQNTIIDYLKHDKKNTHGRVNFVLLKDVGQYVLDCQINKEQIYAAFDFWQQNTTAKSD